MPDAGERYTVSCGCGRFSVSFGHRGLAARGVVRCLVCGARASLPALLSEWQARVAAGDGRDTVRQP